MIIRVQENTSEIRSSLQLQTKLSSRALYMLILKREYCLSIYRGSVSYEKLLRYPHLEFDIVIFE